MMLRILLLLSFAGLHLSAEAYSSGMVSHSHDASIIDVTSELEKIDQTDDENESGWDVSFIAEFDSTTHKINLDIATSVCLTSSFSLWKRNRSTGLAPPLV
jgi:hypothetical protein